MKAESFFKGFKKFSTMFSEGLEKCSKVKVVFHLKENVIPVFKPKPCVPFATLEHIHKKTGRLETLRVISPTDYSEWASPTVYVKKKNNDIHVYVFTNPSTQAGCDTRLSYKWSLTGVNLEFSFS